MSFASVGIRKSCTTQKHREKSESKAARDGWMTLRDLKPGCSAHVVKLTGEGAVRRRIMDMGITRGVEIYVRKVAPLGDPIEVTVRGFELSLRKADAAMIQVEK